MKTILTLFFDLDDTLYRPDSGLWGAIRARIDQYLLEKVGIPADQISHVRESFFKSYGTTLRGLQTEYQVDSRDYLKFVHDIPLDRYIQPDQQLAEVLKRLPHRKVIFTNADRGHAQRVLSILGIPSFFDRIIDILDIEPYCKPMPQAYQIAFEKAGITSPTQCVMLDDSLLNLKTAAELGMRCIWVNPEHQTNHSDCIRIRNLYELPDVISSLCKEDE